MLGIFFPIIGRDDSLRFKPLPNGLKLMQVLARDFLLFVAFLAGCGMLVDNFPRQLWHDKAIQPIGVILLAFKVCLLDRIDFVLPLVTNRSREFSNPGFVG